MSWEWCRRLRRSGVWALVLIAMSGTCLGAEEKLTFDIPAGNARETLNAFGQLAGVQMLFDFAGMRGITTPALHGDFVVTDALRRITEGTPIRFEFVDDHTVTFTIQGARESKSFPPEREMRRSTRPTPRAPSALALVTVQGTPWRTERPVGAAMLSDTRQDIERMGLATLPGVIHTLPQVFGGGPTEDTREIGREARSNSGRGVGVNVRGLDAGSTLVLLNGRRLPAGGSEGMFVDVSNIPLTAVERIDLLPDGALARYGADAVGGVVNMVTRDAAAGAETIGHYGGATQGRYGESQFGQTIGETWHSGEALLAFEYYAHDALPAAGRAQGQSDLTAFGGNNFDSPLSNPGTLLAGGRTWALPRNQDGTALSPSSLTPGTRNLSNRLAGADLVASQQRESLFTTVRQRLTEHVELFADALVTQREARGHSAPFAATLPVPPTNPSYVNPSAIPGPVQVAYNFGPDLGPITADVGIRMRSLTLGADWTVGAWRVTGAASDGSERQRQVTENLVDSAALLAALADPNPATAFNPFGDGSHTNPATLARIRTASLFKTNSHLGTVSLMAEGALGKLPTGEPRLSIGVEHREQALRTTLLSQGASVDARRDLTRQVDAAFAELVVPLIRDDPQRVGADALQLSLSARHERYSDFGAATTPRLGVDWSLSPALVVRAQWGRSFRAPNLADLIETHNVSLLLPQVDPRSAAGQSLALVWSGNNAALREERATSWSLGFGIAPPSVPRLSLALTYYRIDFRDRVQSPTFSNHLLLDPRFAERVTLDPTAAQRAAVCDHTTFFGAPGGCLTAPIGGILGIRLQNDAVMRTDGIDVLGQYAFDTAHGTVELALNGTYVFEYAEALTRGTPLVELVATAHNPPDLRLRTSGSFKQGGWDATAYVNYTDGYRDLDSVPHRRVASWTTADLNLSYTIQSERASSLRGITLSLAIQNLFAANPPFLNNSVGIGYDEENADLTGRTVGFTVRRKW